MDDETNSTKVKKRGRKHGHEIDMMGLSSGGCDRRTYDGSSRGRWPVWNLDSKKAGDVMINGEDFDDSSYLSNSFYEEEEESLEYDDIDNECITDIQGNMILLVDQIGKVIKMKYDTSSAPIQATRITWRCLLYLRINTNTKSKKKSNCFTAALINWNSYLIEGRVWDI